MDIRDKRYEARRFQEFAKKFRFALFDRLLKDKDFDLHIYCSSNLIDFRPIWKAQPKEPTKKSVISDELLSKLASQNNFSSINEEPHIVTPSQVDKIKSISTEFYRVSALTNVLWSDDLIQKYSNYWDWDWLSRNPSIEWTERRIEKFTDNINFHALSNNPSIILKTRTFVDKYSSKWNWEALSGNPEFPRHLGESLFNHECLVWKPRNEKVYKWNLEGINRVFGEDTYEKNCEIRPSVSSNPTFNWKLKDFKNHKDKIDLWILAYHGKISKSIIHECADLLDENRVHHTEFHRFSDWYDNHPSYRNGWENLIKNKNIKQDVEFLKFIQTKTLTLVSFTGDASSGFIEHKNQVPVSSLVLNPENLKLNFIDLTFNSHLLPPNILNETFVHESIWLTIIKPVLLKKRELVEGIINAIRS